MSTRNIKDAKDLSTGELIYFKGHAKATYMSDGRTVEEAVSGMSGVSGGTIDTSNLATKDELAQKQDIISDIDTIRSNAANYKGTVTSVQVNGSSKTPSSGVVNIGNVVTSIKINGQSKSPSSGVVDLGYINKLLSTSTSSSMTLSPNIYYRNTNTSLSALTITALALLSRI